MQETAQYSCSSLAVDIASCSANGDKQFGCFLQNNQTNSDTFSMRKEIPWIHPALSGNSRCVWFIQFAWLSKNLSEVNSVIFTAMRAKESCAYGFGVDRTIERRECNS